MPKLHQRNLEMNTKLLNDLNMTFIETNSYPMNHST